MKKLLKRLCSAWRRLQHESPEEAEQATKDWIDRQW